MQLSLNKVNALCLPSEDKIQYILNNFLVLQYQMLAGFYWVSPGEGVLARMLGHLTCLNPPLFHFASWDFS